MKWFTIILPSLLSFQAVSQIDSTNIDMELNEVVISSDKNNSTFYSKPNHFILDMIKDSTGILILLKNKQSYIIEKVRGIRASENLTLKNVFDQKELIHKEFIQEKCSFSIIVYFSLEKNRAQTVLIKLL